MAACKMGEMLEKPVEIEQAIGSEALGCDNKKGERMVLREIEPTSLKTSCVRSRENKDASDF